MTDREIEQKLAQALEKTAPKDIQGVLSRCEERKGTVVFMNQKKKSRRLSGLIAACLTVALLAGSGVYYQRVCAVASVVSLDVNPSVELTVNRGEKVLSCTPLNEEAKEILADMGAGADLKGAKLDVAVNAIVGSLVRNGYLSSISSAIMISVEDRDTVRAEKLQRELTNTVDDVLQTSASKAAVLTQTLTQDAGLAQQARKNNISTGKAALVKQAISLNGGLKFGELAELSIEELKDLIEAGAPGMPIGTERAMDIAAKEFGKDSSAKMAYSEIDPELDESPAHYEVEITSQDGGEYEYKIDAYTGAVLERKYEGADGTDDDTIAPQPEKPVQKPDAPSGQKTDIGNAKAKSIAMTHAGVKQDAVYDMEVELDEEDGTLVYEVEFKSGNMEYSYEIDAASGAVLKHESERDD